MFEIRWIQNDSTIIKRQLPDALGSSEFIVSTAVKDLLYCIAYNEDSQLVNLDLYEPLHLELRFELWAEEGIYSSLNQNVIFNSGSFAIGSDVHSFYGFYTAHQVLWETKRFYERQLFCHTGPLYELFFGTIHTVPIFQFLLVTRITYRTTAMFFGICLHSFYWIR